MLGWLSDASVRASRSKRARRSGSSCEARQDFERDVAPQLRVARAIDLAHSAGADSAGDFIGAEPRARG